ncbi:MAG: DUF4115 domain-containing protein [Zoogloeaceae bacterium]|jgi:cytoskeleton protein RodZ|nr:DUF4115 domain-containing protein [Zoogloeaceae bacterium]
MSRPRKLEPDKASVPTPTTDPETDRAETPAGLRHVRETLQSRLADQPEQPELPEQTPLAAEVRVGRQLKAAREALKLEISDVAQRLCLGERQIVALENGDLAALPGKAFVRGFVRNYARAVALEEAPLLKALDGVNELVAPKLELPESTHVAMPSRQDPDNRTSWRAIAVVILFLAAIPLYFFWPEQSWLPRPWTEDEHAAPEEWTQGEQASIPADAPAAQEIAVTLPAPAVETPPAESAVVAPVPAPSAPTARGAAQFSFTQESWVEVRDKNGVVLSSRQHAAGTSHAISGAPPLTVVIGKASGVTLTYQGKPVALQPNAERDTARVVLP